jgi:chromosome segregation ATPase
MVTATSTDTGRRGPLKKRRKKAESARRAAEAAQERVAALDARLAANSQQTEREVAALRQARDEASRLKKAIKQAAKERGGLRSARKAAQKAAARSRRRAEAADAKYDRVVLAELVRREKKNQAARDAASAPATIGAAPERVGPGSAVATQTAARKTAAAAVPDGASGHDGS